MSKEKILYLTWIFKIMIARKIVFDYLIIELYWKWLQNILYFSLVSKLISRFFVYLLASICFSFFFPKKICISGGLELCDIFFF